MASAVTSLQFESTLKHQQPAPLYLIVGEEDLLRDSAIAALKATVLGDGGDFNYDLFYGDEASGAEILTCASEIPVFAERRLVIVKGAEKLSARESEALLAYLKDPVETTTLVFATHKLDGRLKFSQALARGAITIDCAPLRDAQLSPWLARDAERLGLRLDDSAAQLLKEVSGGSLYSVRRELEKLAAYVPAGRPVAGSDVQALRGMEAGASVFDLTGAIADADHGRVLSILARNLEAGEAPLRILGSLAWQYRRVWKTKELLQTGGREGEAARNLRVDPLHVRAFLGRFSDRHLQAALQLFLEADARLKGGSSGHPRIIMERLLMRLCDDVDGIKGSKPEPPRRPPAPSGRGAARVLSNVRTIKSGNRTTR
jgi:DNA polymerase-3 subunit delta